MSWFKYRVRVRLANVLYRSAFRLDPVRPVAIADRDGWIVKLDGVAIARVKTGMVMKPCER